MPGRWSTWLTDLTQGALDLLLPPVCVACEGPLPSAGCGFCGSCKGRVIAPGEACPRCAASVGPFTRSGDGCLECRNERFQFAGTDRLGKYDGLLRELVLRTKRAPGEFLAEHLGRLWAETRGEALAQLGAEIVVPVPLHWTRRLWRGYNQCEVLGDHLAKRLQRPFRPGLLRRARRTEFQARRSVTERRSNVAGAFAARPVPELRGRTVLLVDDVLTTGSTANEAATVLRAAGASRVFVAVLARAG